MGIKENIQKKLLTFGNLLIIALIITIVINNSLFFTLLKFGNKFNENTVKDYSFFDINPIYIEFVDEEFRPALIINDDDVNKLYSNLLKLEKYDGREFNGEPVYSFQLYNSKKGSIAIRRYDDKLVVNINDQLFYASEPLIETLERFKTARTIGSILIE